MKPWEIVWGERSWTDDDVLGSDMADVQLLIGGDWTTLDPWGGPLQLMAWITTLECRTTGRDLQEVMQEIRESPADEIVAALRARSLRSVESTSA